MSRRISILRFPIRRLCLLTMPAKTVFAFFRQIFVLGPLLSVSLGRSLLPRDYCQTWERYRLGLLGLLYPCPRRCRTFWVLLNPITPTRLAVAGRFRPLLRGLWPRMLRFGCRRPHMISLFCRRPFRPWTPTLIGLAFLAPLLSSFR